MNLRDLYAEIDRLDRLVQHRTASAITERDRADRAEAERNAALRALALHHSHYMCPECDEVIENGSPHNPSCIYYAADMAARKMGEG